MSVLLFKEIKRFTSSATYMLNCGLGIIMMPLAGVFLLVAGREFIAVLETVFTGDGIVSILLTIMLFAIIAMNDIATPSVSLEGSSLWILQSLPVTARQVLGAKFMLQFVFTAVPAVFTMLCVVIIYPEAWLLIPVGLTFIALICAFDLMLGLLMPNLNWTSELAPIKKSISVLIALFGGWVYAAVFIVIYFLVAWPMGYTLYMIMYTLINLILASLLGLWIKYRGAVIFTDL
jgi:ABC-2 type transport system permease protein